MPAPLFQPIVHLARTQLEDLVKNLDAELVLDCVSKKMFDNFSMWDLQLKKMQLNKEKGLKRLEVMLEDMENVLVELKKMVDNCLTHTKLCDNPPPSVTLGKNLFLLSLIQIWRKFDKIFYKILESKNAWIQTWIDRNWLVELNIEEVKSFPLGEKVWKFFELGLQ